MVAESGAVLLDEAARDALVGTAAAARDRDHARTSPRRACSPAPDAPEDVEELARALHALGPDVVVVTGGHRDEATDVLFDGDGVHLIPGERHPDGAAHGSGCTHSSALAAHLALGHRRSRRRARPRAIAAAAVRDGLRGIGRGARPVDVLGLTADGRRGRSYARRSLGYSRPTMKFLRMRPGFGEQLIAEGDVEVAEEEQALIEEFRRQLDQGMWAAVPTTRAAAGARPRWCARSRTSRATPAASSSSRAPPAAR